LSQAHPSFYERYRAKRELPELTRQISDLLGVGERMDNALDTVAQLTTSTWLREVLLDLRGEIQGGSSLSEALRGHAELYSDYFVAIVAIGEARGDVSGALRQIADQLIRQQRFSDALKTALSYPLLVLVVTGISLVLMLVYVLPEFHELFLDTGTELPWLSRSVLGLGGFVRTWGLPVVLVLAAALFAWRFSLRQPETLYRWHRIQLHVPLISEIVRRTDVVRFSDSLAAALSGGTTLIDGLRLSQASMMNRYIRRSLNDVIDSVKEGGRLGDGLHDSCDFPLLATRMIKIGEESGNLEKSLRRVAEVYDREFDTTLKRMLNVLEPVLIVSIGAVVAIIVLAMVSAIQELNNMPF